MPKSSKKYGKTGKNEPERQLIERVVQLKHDPYGYVMYAFPWGKAGTVLEKYDGPDKWQTKALLKLGELSEHSGGQVDAEAVRIAIRSGHGVGKGAMTAWIIQWFMATRRNPQIVVTANTKNQLDTKTWRELAKWHSLAINKHWFVWTATRFSQVDNPETWFAAAIPWSEHNSEAFAGTHEENVLVIFDEASAISPKIWQVTEGAMTTPGAFWLTCGNPTQNTGNFAECWGSKAHRWNTVTVDSRTAKMTNKIQIQQWIDDYGEDSDFVRVRVRGLPPRASTMQFIGQDLVDAAVARRYERKDYEYAPVILGVDVARYGDDQSVLYVRQGLETHYIGKHRELSLMTLASLVIEAEDRWKVNQTFVDVCGMGAGVVDRLRQLGRNPIGVNAGERATDKKYYNKRAEMAGKVKDWLDAGGSIPNDETLIADMTGFEYGYSAKEQLQIEKKEDMKARGLASPDTFDALALTFAYLVEMSHSPQGQYTGSLGRNYGDDKNSWMGVLTGSPFG